MSYFSRTRRTAAEALSLRAWVIRRLLGGVDEEAPPASAHAWHIVLRWERCALLLQDSLGSRASQLPPACAAELRTAAMRESQWILSARAQLHSVSRIAAADGIRIVALKSTAEVARGRNVQATDVDLLVAPENASRLTQQLDATGFSPQSKNSRGQLPPRTFDGALKVEVHLTVSGFDTPEAVPWDGVRAIDARSPLLRLAPQDHVWTVLCQATRHHPDRRTRIRDLYMVRNALLECTREERAVLDGRVAGDSYRSELMEMIALASDPGWESSATQKKLRRLYLLHAREPAVGPATRRWMLWRMVIDSVSAGAWQEWRRNQWRREFTGVPRLSVKVVLVSAPLALATALVGRLASFDEFLMER